MTAKTLNTHGELRGITSFDTQLTRIGARIVFGYFDGTHWRESSDRTKMPRPQAVWRDGKWVRL